MRLALVVLVAVVGIGLTLVAATRLWTASRSDAPREIVLGYVAMMIAASLFTMLALRAL